MLLPNIGEMIDYVGQEVKYRSKLLKTMTWQGIPTQGRPDMAMYEVCNMFVKAPMPVTVDQLVKECQPNLPWADDHFKERVGGQPLNPPPSWVNWPYAHSAAKFKQEQFNHSYPERFWPRTAGMTPNGVTNETPMQRLTNDHQGLRGIRYRYGDYTDLLNLLLRDPETRQAYLPIFFPEDTGAHHKDRVPCTLGYHFMRRDDKLHLFYPIRSCDYVRHFRDDIYLAVKLVLHTRRVLSTFRPVDWDHVVPGTLSFWAGSMHCFVNDMRVLKGDAK